LKKILLDLNTAALFGPSSKFVEMIPGYIHKGYEVVLIKKDWGKNHKTKGTTFDKKTGEFIKGKSQFLWDPNTHPEDYFGNLVTPSYTQVSYLEKENWNQIWSLFKTVFSRNYIPYITAVMMMASPHEKKRILRQKKREIFKIYLKHKAPFHYAIHYYGARIAPLYKIKPKSEGFRYLLAKKLMTVELKKFIEHAKSGGKKYILISVLWDENMKFEVQDDRLKGGPVLTPDHEEQFESLKRYIAKLDTIILKRDDYKFLLASKKAVDWGKLIKSDYLDLRNFEEYGFTLSQMIYICQELSVATINWPSTFSIWITPCKEIIHLTWNDNKDTARWARNTLHLQSPQELINLLEKKYENPVSQGSLAES